MTKSTFVRNVATVASGTAAAQLISISLSAVITRLFAPEAFGILGAFTSAANMLIPVAALAYPIAIVLPKQDTEARQIARLSAYIALAFTSVLFVILAVFGEQLLSALGLAELSQFAFLLPVFVLFSALLHIATQWLIRKRKFTVIARANVLQAVAIGANQIAMGFLLPIAASLIYITSLGALFHTFLLTKLSRSKQNLQSRHTSQDAPSSMAIASIREVAHRYRDFPIFRAPERLLTSASTGLPVLVLAALFSPAVAGYYTLCRMVLNAPSRLIGTSIGDVFYPRITEAANKGQLLTPLIVKATAALAVVGALPFLLVIAFGPFLFGFVFGEEWVMAGEFARWIALWRYLALMNRPAIHSLPVLNAQRFHLVFSMFNITLRIAVLVIGYFVFNSALISVALFGVVGMLINIYLILAVWRMAHRFDTRLKDAQR